MLLRSYFSGMLFPLGLVLVVIPHLVHSIPDDVISKDTTLSNQSDESKSDVLPSSVTLPLVKPALSVFLASNSDKVVKRATKAKAVNNIAEIIRGDEKFKTAATTTPFGFAANGVVGEFNTPHAGGIYAGGIPHGLAPPHAGYGGGYSGFFGRTPGQHLLNGGQPGIIAPAFVGHPGGPGGAYGGVVYGGHGNNLGFGQEQVTVNKQTEVGIGPYGVDQRRDTIQKSVNRFQGGAVGVAAPISYYGNQGVVYMGHGEGGVLQSGHLGHYQQGLHQGRQFGSYGSYNGAGDIGFHNPIDVNLNRVNPYQQGVQGIPVQHGHGHAVGAGGYGGPGGYGGHESVGGFGGPGGYPQQGVSINKQSEIGVDPYGGVHRNVNVQRTAVTTDGVGYNGFQNNVIAHTDQAFIGPDYRGHGLHVENRGGIRRPGGYDPYLNQVDSIYNGGHQSRLLSTGPNRFYQGANPAGVYNDNARYHRFG